MNDPVEGLIQEFEHALDDLEKGGPGSGFHGHAGRPGLRGGSQAQDTSGAGSPAEPQGWGVRSGEIAYDAAEDQVVQINGVNEDGTADVTVLSGRDRGSNYRSRDTADFEEADDYDVELWTSDSAQATADRAIEVYGLTDDPRKGGYIMPDGQMLDLSGGDWGGGRSLDHRDVGVVLGENDPGGTDGMVLFMHRTGAVRMSYFQDGSFTLDFARKPTGGQLGTIARIANQSSDLIWDVTRYDPVTNDWTVERSGEGDAGYDVQERMLEDVNRYLPGPVLEKGGPGSGFHAHAGRPGKRGGSAHRSTGAGPNLGPKYEAVAVKTNIHLKSKTMKASAEKVVSLYRERLGGRFPKDLTITDNIDEAMKYVEKTWEVDPKTDVFEKNWLEEVEAVYQGNLASYVDTTSAYTNPPPLVYLSPDMPSNKQQREYILAHELGHMIDQRVLTPARMGMMPPNPPHNFIVAMFKQGYEAEEWPREYVADLLATSLLRGPKFDHLGIGYRKVAGPDVPQMQADAASQWEYLVRKEAATPKVRKGLPRVVRRRLVGEIDEVVWLEPDVQKGGPGSGHHGHRGRPGMRGGSLPGMGSVATPDVGAGSAIQSLTDIAEIPKEAPRPRSSMSYEKAKIAENATDHILGESAATAEFDDYETIIAQTLTEQYDFPEDAMWALSPHDEADLLLHYMVNDPTANVQLALMGERDFAMLNNTGSRGMATADHAGELLGEDKTLGKDGILGRVVSVPEKYAMDFPDNAITNMYPEFEGGPDPGKFFEDHPHGGLVFSTGWAVNEYQAQLTGESQSREYILLTHNVLNRKKNTQWGERAWRMSVFAPDGTPTGHVSTDFMDELMWRLSNQISSPGNEYWQFEGAVADPSGQAQKELGYGLTAWAQFEGIGNLLKGGPGSGFHGHAGRPGLRGGSQAREAIAGLANAERLGTGMVSGFHGRAGGTADDILARVPNIGSWKAVHDALAIPDEVHAVPVPPDWSPLPVGADDSNEDRGGGYVSDQDGAPQKILVRKGEEKYGSHPMCAAVHEYGHLMDAMLGSKVRPDGSIEWGYISTQKDSDPLVKAWFDAVVASRGAKALIKFPAGRSWTDNWGNRQKLSKHDRKTLLRSVEVWARAYTQWIALRSGNKALKKSLTQWAAEYAEGGGPKLQWTDRDFAPIAETMDAIFEDRGLLR